MNPIKILVCGSRGRFKDYRELVYAEMDELYAKYGKNMMVVEGCCKNSADEYAEEWAKMKGIDIEHHPVKKGERPPKRNIEMANICDEAIGFYDRWSYGTAQTLANVLLINPESRPKTIELTR